MSLKLVHGVGAEGLTTCDHPESGAMGATEAHQQQQHSAKRGGRLKTSCARTGLLVSNSTFGDFCLGRVASGKPARGKPTRTRLGNGAVRAKAAH
jgi:hypothetical protein